jgi:peptidyl-prolyl cis-trans isomerase D
MIISRINQFCARHGRITYSFIGVAMIIPFVFLYGTNPQSLVEENRSVVMGSLYGEKYLASDFFEQMLALEVTAFMQNRQLDTNSADGIRATAPEVLRRMRLLREAERLKIDAVQPEELRNRIQSLPLFRSKDGGFDNEIYMGFLNNFLPRFRNQLTRESLNASRFDQVMRESIMIERVTRRITDAITVSEPQLNAVYVSKFSVCDSRVATFSYLGYRDDVEVNEDDVRAYFDTHKDDKYQISKQTEVETAIFRASDFVVTPPVTDEQVEEHYNAQFETLFKRDQVRLRHIMIKLEQDASEELAAKATELIEKIRSSLDGTNFEASATEHSEDLSSARKGGDLGFLEPVNLRARYGPEFAAAVAKLGVGETSAVIKSNRGLHVVEKVETRDSIPLADASRQIRFKLERELDEAEARERYTADRDAHEVDEVLLNQIQLNLPPTATEADKQTARSRLEAYRQQAVAAAAIQKQVEAITLSEDDSEEEKAQKRDERKKLLAALAKQTNFARLARDHSEDPSTSSQGGTLGWRAMDDRRPPLSDPAFSRAAKALANGSISQVVETRQGMHLIQRLDGRTRTKSFAEVSASMIREIRNERREAGDKAARKAASQFSLATYDSLIAGDVIGDADAFVAFARRYFEENKVTATCVRSGYFTEIGPAPEIPYSHTLARKASALAADKPLSEVVSGAQVYWVAFWRGSKPPSAPPFKTQNDDGEDVLSEQAKQAESDLKRERAVALAREAARAAYKRVSDAIGTGMTFAEATAEDSFAESIFPLETGPQSPRGGPAPNGDEIKDAAQKTAAGTVAAPLDTDDGAVIVYVVAHQLPTPDNFAEFRSVYGLPPWMGEVGFKDFRNMFVSQYRRHLQQAALEGYYEQLEKASQTSHHEDWDFIFNEPAPETDADADEAPANAES